jgi:hypothetical protein
MYSLMWGLRHVWWSTGIFYFPMVLSLVKCQQKNLNKELTGYGTQNSLNESSVPCTETTKSPEMQSKNLAVA